VDEQQDFDRFRQLILEPSEGSRDSIEFRAYKDLLTSQMCNLEQYRN
jgi:hypothetical protein